MRMEVKLGLLICGVVLACLAVYLALTQLGGGGGDAPQQLATATPAGNATATTPRPTDARPTTPTTTTPPRATNPVPPISVPPRLTGGTGTTPPTPVRATPPADAAVAADDPWKIAFDTNTVPAPRTTTARPPVVTRTPDAPGSRTNAAPPASTGDRGTLLNTPGTRTLTPPVPARTPDAAAAARTHAVEAGDTFSKLAERYLGSRNRHALIAAANPGVDPARLKIGQTLAIPAAPSPLSADAPADDGDAFAANPRPSTLAAGASAASRATAAALDAATQYRVQPGESLWVISTRLYGTGGKSEALFQANRALLGDNPGRLKPGMVLALPEPPTAGTASVR